MSDKEICSDCGATIARFDGRPAMFPDLGWAHERSPGMFDFCCRYTIQNGVLVSCDYHAPAGEEQRHWQLPPPRCEAAYHLGQSAGHVWLDCAYQAGHEGKHVWFDELPARGPQRFATWTDRHDLEWREM